MADKFKPTPGQSGAAGEYFVAAELWRRGYVAALTMRGTRGIDFIASSADATRSVAIQVKTKYGTGAQWLLSRKVEDLALAENLVFVFVVLNMLDAPQYHIVPRDIVIRFASDYHSKWLSGVKRSGLPRKDTDMRVFHDSQGQFLNRWDFLDLDPSAE